jgi:predicted nuclease of predicted toxin-antitoxin system
MNFLVDAQLPRRMTGWLTAAGCDARHTLDLPDGNRTTDAQINDVADREQRAVVTKDADFVDSHILRGRPAKLLLISTGNISNRDLEALVVPLLADIIREFRTHSFLELGPAGIVVRG